MVLSLSLPPWLENFDNNFSQEHYSSKLIRSSFLNILLNIGLIER